MANLIASYSEANQNVNGNISSGDATAVGQSFAGNGDNLDSCKFYIKRNGSPTGNAVAKLYAHSGTFGTSSVPTGSALDTSTTSFNVATLTTSFQLITFNFAGTYNLINGTNYVIVLEYSGGDTSNRVIAGKDSTSPTDPGNASYFQTGTWNLEGSPIDLCFYVYGNTPSSASRAMSTLFAG